MNEKNVKSLGKDFFHDCVPSKHGYPEGFKVTPLKEQIVKISSCFGLDPKNALNFAEELPSFKRIARGEYFYDIDYFAIAKLSVIKNRFSGSDESRYCKASILALTALAETQNLKFFPEKIIPDNFKMNKRTKKFVQKIEDNQDGDIIILPASFGLIHRGKSPHLVNKELINREFGLDVFYVSCMTFTNKLRYQDFDILGVDCIGTEYLCKEDGQIFQETPVIRMTQGDKFNQKFLEINSRSFYQGCSYQGSATGLLLNK